MQEWKNEDYIVTTKTASMMTRWEVGGDPRFYLPSLESDRLRPVDGPTSSASWSSVAVDACLRAESWNGAWNACVDACDIAALPPDHRCGAPLFRRVGDKADNAARCEPKKMHPDEIGLQSGNRLGTEGSTIYIYLLMGDTPVTPQSENTAPTALLEHVLRVALGPDGTTSPGAHVPFFDVLQFSYHAD